MLQWSSLQEPVLMQWSWNRGMKKRRGELNDSNKFQESCQTETFLLLNQYPEDNILILRQRDMLKN